MVSVFSVPPRGPLVNGYSDVSASVAVGFNEASFTAVRTIVDNYTRTG